MMRRPYRTACRFLTDDDTESTVRWYEARADARTLPFVSVISSLDWENEPKPDEGPGEVVGAARPFTPGVAPVGLIGEHQCGTEEEFSEGGTFDEESPPAKYAANGFALCCRSGVLVRGGAGASGHAHLVVLPPLMPGPTCPASVLVTVPSSGVFTLAGGAQGWFKCIMVAGGVRLAGTSSDPAATCEVLPSSCAFFPFVPPTTLPATFDFGVVPTGGLFLFGFKTITGGTFTWSLIHRPP